MKIPFFEIHILKTETLDRKIDRISADRARVIRQQLTEAMNHNIILAHKVNRLTRRRTGKS